MMAPHSSTLSSVLFFEMGGPELCSQLNTPEEAVLLLRFKLLLLLLLLTLLLMLL